MGKQLRFQDYFEKNSGFRIFLISILVTGLSYGMQRGMLETYLAEIVHMTEMDRGIIEFFRELPGVLIVLILAAFYMFSAESLYKSGAVIMLAGLIMYAILPPVKGLVILTAAVYSLGEHIQLGMKSTISLSYAREGHGGSALGVQNAANQIGTLVGYLIIVAVFVRFTGTEQTYQMAFWAAALLAAVSMLLTMGLRSSSRTDESKRRFHFRRKFTKYYMLEMFYGARKQVFFTFGPYVLILFYGANAAAISLLYAISAIACFLTSPIVGQIIDRLGYKVVMVADTLILVIVCFFYGFAHRIFPQNVAFIVCCVNYILDSVISQASMASNVYVQDLADSADEMRATITTGVSINHLITIFIALFGGWIWQTLGMELLFILSAALGLCNSAYAATIRTRRKTA